MAIIQFTVEVDIKNLTTAQAVDYFVSDGYKETVPDPASTEENPLPPMPNPESKVNFAKREVGEFVRDRIKGGYVDAKRKTDLLVAQADVEGIVVI